MGGLRAIECRAAYGLFLYYLPSGFSIGIIRPGISVFLDLQCAGLAEPYLTNSGLLAVCHSAWLVDPWILLCRGMGSERKIPLSPIDEY